MFYISQYFTKEDFEKSRTAEIHKLDNRIPDKYLLNAVFTANKLLDPIQKLVWCEYSKEQAVELTSGYRGKQVNDIVSKSKTSQHLEGKAADFIVTPGCDIKELFITIKNKS